jgi:hypothetical protein
VPVTSLADLRTGVYYRLDGNTALYTTAEVDAAINEAVRTLNLLTGFYQTRAAVSIASRIDRKFYQVPSEIIVPLGVYVDSLPLAKTTVSRLTMEYPDWFGERSTSRAPAMLWAPMGLRTIIVYPPAHIAGQLITVSGIGETPLLVSDTDEIPITDDLADVLEDLSFHVLPLKVGGAEFEQQLPVYRGFLSRAKEIKRWVGLRNPRFFFEGMLERRSK